MASYTPVYGRFTELKPIKTLRFGKPDSGGELPETIVVLEDGEEVPMSKYLERISQLRRMWAGGSI